MKRSEAAEIVLTLIKAYPHVRCDDQTADIYERNISDLDAGTCRAAVQRLMHTSKFFPTIAEIREACAAQSHGVARTGEEAYAELTRAVRMHGRDYGQGAPKFRDPLISSCIGVWGTWNDLCGSPVDDPGGRARFVELYDEFATRQRRDLASGRPLPASNSAAPAFWLERPKARAPEPEPVPLAQAPVGAMLAALAPRLPANRGQGQAPRRWSADELDSALGATGVP